MHSLVSPFGQAKADQGISICLKIEKFGDLTTKLDWLKFINGLLDAYCFNFSILLTFDTKSSDPTNILESKDIWTRLLAKRSGCNGSQQFFQYHNKAGGQEKVCKY